MRKYDTPADDRDNMNLRQLDAFRAVMMTGSVTNAADYLHLSQPAVSRLIGDLERSVGFSLFIRAKGSPLVPTPEAESLYSEVERTFAGMDALRRAADDIKSFRSGNLRIACLPALAMGFMPAVIEAFRAEHPTVTIQLQTRSSSTVRQWVAAQQFDLGLARPGDYPGVIKRSFLSIPGVCVLPEDHRLCSKLVISPEDLSGEDFISLGMEDVTRARTDRLFEDFGVVRNVVAETEYAATICGLVLRGIGISIINPITAIDFLERNIVVRRFEPEILFDYDLFLPQHRPVSRLTRTFLDILESKRDEAVRYAGSQTNV